MSQSTHISTITAKAETLEYETAPEVKLNIYEIFEKNYDSASHLKPTYSER